MVASLSSWQAVAGQLSQRLLDFYDQWGRKLPWRETGDPYAIWLAEVMLQQTGVGTVLPYYERFLHRFPSVAALAAAPVEEVLALWQGLGYYRRAHHLHRAACLVVERHGGCFPQDLAGWRALPGVGDNTAAAIMAIAFHAPTAILDGNVKRVLSRLIALPHPPEEHLADLWQLAQWLTPEHRAGDYAQAIMDLGATLCLPRQPQCPRCPWSAWCQGLASGHAADFPLSKAKATKPRLLQHALLMQRPGGELFLVRRPQQGLLAGLWQPPASQPLPQLTDLSPLLAQWQIASAVEPLPLVRHVFTHFHLTVHPHLCRVEDIPPPEQQTWCWADAALLQSLPIATLHRKVLSLAK